MQQTAQNYSSNHLICYKGQAAAITALLLLLLLVVSACWASSQPA
jgi:hypothetical protein